MSEVKQVVRFTCLTMTQILQCTNASTKALTSVKQHKTLLTAFYRSTLQHSRAQNPCLLGLPILPILLHGFIGRTVRKCCQQRDLYSACFTVPFLIVQPGSQSVFHSILFSTQKIARQWRLCLRLLTLNDKQDIKPSLQKKYLVSFCCQKMNSAYTCSELEKMHPLFLQMLLSRLKSSNLQWGLTWPEDEERGTSLHLCAADLMTTASSLIYICCLHFSLFFFNPCSFMLVSRFIFSCCQFPISLHLFPIPIYQKSYQ